MPERCPSITSEARELPEKTLLLPQISHPSGFKSSMASSTSKASARPNKALFFLQEKRKEGTASRNNALGSKYIPGA